MLSMARGWRQSRICLTTSLSDPKENSQLKRSIEKKMTFLSCFFAQWNFQMLSSFRWPWHLSLSAFTRSWPWGSAKDIGLLWSRSFSFFFIIWEDENHSMNSGFVVGLVCSLLFSIFFSGIEVAFLSANKVQLQLQGQRGNRAENVMSFFNRK